MIARTVFFSVFLFQGVALGVPLDEPADRFVFNERRIATIKVSMSTNDFRTMLSGRTPGAVHLWVPATVDFDGLVLNDVAMRVKGNNSLGISSGQRIPYKLDFNRFVPSQNLHGVKMLNLHSFSSEYLVLSDFLSYGAFRAEGIPAPRTGWAELWLNGRNLGTYTTIEQVGQSFIDRHFKFKRGDLYKPEFPSGDLKWVDANITSYPTLGPELQEGSDHSAILRFLDVINHQPVSAFPSVVDLKLTLAYFAGNVALGNADTYTETGHNYYLYESSPGKFAFLPWDMNLSQEASGRNLVPPVRGDKGNRFTAKLLGDPTNREIYHRILWRFLEGGASKQALNHRVDLALAVLSNRVEQGTAAILRTNILRRTGSLFTNLFLRLGPSPFPAVEISEVLASNTRVVKDEFGEFDDYVELRNGSNHAVDLAGMYLSDDIADPTKFQFPEGLVISPGEYLLLWADGDAKQGSLHLPFKLSANGETLVLSDLDARANFVLDTFAFGLQRADVAEGRLAGPAFIQASLSPTPGAPNQFNDSDLDGLPDEWEVEVGLTRERDDALEDKDNDGFTNLQEFANGSDPGNPDSPLRIRLVISNPRMATLSWSIHAQAFDVLDTSTNLAGPWRAVEVFRGRSNTLQVVSPTESRFYRLRRFLQP